MIGQPHGDEIPLLWIKIILDKPSHSKGILSPWFRPIVWVLILKLSKSFYNESDLLFHVLTFVCFIDWRVVKCLSKMNEEYFDCKMLMCSNNVESSFVAQ